MLLNKRLYTGFSTYQFIFTLLLRLVCVFGLIISLSHYSENPIIVIIAAAICTLFIFILGDDQIIVYSDRITQTTNSFWNLILRSKGQTILIAQIKLAHLQKPIQSDKIEIATALLLTTILPTKAKDTNKTKPIFFDLVNGQTIQINTNLEDRKIRQIVDLTNSLAKQNCP